MQIGRSLTVKLLATLGNSSIMRMGKFGTFKIEGIGVVHVKTNIRCKLVLRNIKHILTWCQLASLMKRVLITTLVMVLVDLPKGSMVIAEGRRCSSVYKTQTWLFADEVNSVEKDSKQVSRKNVIF